jgi:hypothetical protein
MSKDVMLAESIYDPQTHYSEMGKDGAIRIYNIMTGECVAVLAKGAEVERMPVEFVEVTREDGTKVLAQKNVALDEKALAIRGGKLTPLLRDVICSRIAGGEALKKISEEPDMPSFATFTKWYREDEDFRKAIDNARQARSELYAEQALEEAREATPTMPGVAKAKLIVDTLWKSAEHDNPKRFGPKNKGDVHFNAPVSFVIDTGIRRKGDPGYNVDETQKIKEAREVSQIDTGGEPDEGGSSAK